VGIVLKKKIDEETLLGIWEIAETEQYFKDNLNLNQGELAFLKNVTFDQRRLQWLGSRLMLRKLIEELCDEVSESTHIQLEVNQNGKPLLKFPDYNSSISHSRKMAAVVISKSKLVGVDIEIIEDKIERIAHKFLNQKEHEDIENSNHGSDANRGMLYVYWCVKESIYKSVGQKGLIFGEDIILNNFYYSDNGGEVIIRVSDTNQSSRLFNAYYQKLEDYMLVYSGEL